MNVPFVDLKSQYERIKNEIDRAIKDVINDSSFIGGSYVKAFEEQFARYCGVKYCKGVGNGTDALYITLKALGIGKGDEVITVANTFIATSEAITSTGAKVVFVDCDPDYYNIDIEKMENSITSKTKAIIPVHLYGQPADMEKINRIAKKHDLYVVEDAAQAHGAKYQGRRVGGLGDVGCFSFYPGKNLGAYGDAGAIVTNDSSIVHKCMMLANHGRVEKYEHRVEGYNSRLDGMQAAVLSVKLKHLDKWNRERNKAADFYRKIFKDTEIVLPKIRNGVEHVYHLFVVQVERRDELMNYLKENGINTGIHYPIPLPMQKAYGYLGYDTGDFRTSEYLADTIVSMPIFPEITKEQQQYVAEKIKFFYKADL